MFAGGNNQGTPPTSDDRITKHSFSLSVSTIALPGREPS